MTPPSSNASENSANARRAAKTVPPSVPIGDFAEPEPVVDFRFGVCTCGCDGPTTKQFLAGHNQRLRGALRRAHRLGRRVRVVQPVGQPMSVTAVTAAEVLGGEWLAFVSPQDAGMVEHEANVLRAAADAFEAEWREGLGL